MGKGKTHILVAVSSVLPIENRKEQKKSANAMEACVPSKFLEGILQRK